MKCIGLGTEWIRGGEQSKGREVRSVGLELTERTVSSQLIAVRNIAAWVEGREF